MSLTFLIIEMTSTLFKTKEKARGATEWFYCRVIFRVSFLFFALTDNYFLVLSNHECLDLFFNGYQGASTLEIISFLVFGNPDETLALVYEILHARLFLLTELKA